MHVHSAEFIDHRRSFTLRFPTMGNENFVQAMLHCIIVSVSINWPKLKAKFAVQWLSLPSDIETLWSSVSWPRPHVKLDYCSVPIILIGLGLMLVTTVVYTNSRNGECTVLLICVSSMSIGQWIYVFPISKISVINLTFIQEINEINNRR